MADICFRCGEAYSMDGHICTPGAAPLSMDETTAGDEDIVTLLAKRTGDRLALDASDEIKALRSRMVEAYLAGAGHVLAQLGEEVAKDEQDAAQQWVAARSTSDQNPT